MSTDWGPRSLRLCAVLARGKRQAHLQAMLARSASRTMLSSRVMLLSPALAPTHALAEPRARSLTCRAGPSTGSTSKPPPQHRSIAARTPLNRCALPTCSGSQQGRSIGCRGQVELSYGAML